MSCGEETVAVVVVTYNSAELLADLIESLPAGLAGARWHLTIADNASSDGSVRRARELAPAARVVETGRNGGYAAGINAAVAAAEAHTAILVLNPDVRLQPGCVAELLRTLRTPGTGIAVPRLIDAHGDLIESQRREPTVLRAFADAVIGGSRAGRYALLGEVVTDRRRYESPGVTDWAEGSTLLVSDECWRRCAPWDEYFFLYSEETDFALRARDAGLLTRYVPTAGAVHLEGGSGTTPELWTLVVLNRVRLFRRRHGMVQSTAFWAAVLLREGSRAVMGKRTSRAAVRALVSRRRFREPPGPDVVRPRGASRGR
jgi:N-acetylglucosaminyl-diphospho-decaprenol L-rhamnosyltransferase